MQKTESALDPSQRMRVAYILTMVGGFLDAYTYCLRGGVFANAQTGNIVKMGISLANGTPELILSCLAPICSFAAGLMLALAVKESLDRRGIRLVRRLILVAEMVALVIVTFIPLEGELDILASSIVSLVAAMQYETFTTFRGEAIVTTMSTGNLRKMVDALFLGIVRRNTAALQRAWLYFTIITTFAAGAFFGSLSCDMLENLALLPAILALGLVVAIITHLRRKNLTAQS